MNKNNWITKLFQKIKDSIKHANYDEPYVRQNCDRFGNLYWRIYDRRTNKSYTFGSELEVKAWLEQRARSA